MADDPETLYDSSSDSSGSDSGTSDVMIPLVKTDDRTKFLAPEWDQYLTYQEGRFVAYKGKFYQVIKGVLSNTPPDEDTEHWAEKRLDELMLELSFVYSPERDYVVGEIVYKDGCIYRCKANHTSTQDFNSNYFTEIINLKNKTSISVDDKILKIDSYSYSTKSTGGYGKLSGIRIKFNGASSEKTFVDCTSITLNTADSNSYAYRIKDNTAYTGDFYAYLAVDNTEVVSGSTVATAGEIVAKSVYPIKWPTTSGTDVTIEFSGLELDTSTAYRLAFSDSNWSIGDSLTVYWWWDTGIGVRFNVNSATGTDELCCYQYGSVGGAGQFIQYTTWRPIIRIQGRILQGVVTPLEGKSYDLSTTVNIANALKEVIETFGGTVTALPSS